MYSWNGKYYDEDDGDDLVQATRKLSRWEFAGW